MKDSTCIPDVTDMSVTAMTYAPATMSSPSAPVSEPDLQELEDMEFATSEDMPWVCIVWDDPVNLMSYVTYVFQTILGYGRARAQELMMQVHTEGKAVVSSGSKDKVEVDVQKLHTAGLWATMEQA